MVPSYEIPKGDLGILIILKICEILETFPNYAQIDLPLEHRAQPQVIDPQLSLLPRNVSLNRG